MSPNSSSHWTMTYCFWKPPYITSPRCDEHLWYDHLLIVHGKQVVSCSSMLPLFVSKCQLVWLHPSFRNWTCLFIYFATGKFVPRNQMISMAHADSCSDGCWSILHDKQASHLGIVLPIIPRNGMNLIAKNTKNIFLPSKKKRGQHHQHLKLCSFI